MLSGIFSAICLLLFCGIIIYMIYMAFFGKCPYCGSNDIIPDYGPIFYCNGCHKKF